MNDEQLYLTDDERDHFRKWESLFESEGWQLLAAELSSDAESLPERTFRNARDWDEVLAARAAERKLREVLSYPDQIARRKQGLILMRQYEAEESRNEAVDV